MGGAVACLLKDLGLDRCPRKYEGWAPEMGMLFRDIEGDSPMRGSFKTLGGISDVSA